MCIRCVALALCLLATVARADPVRDALGADDAKLVVVLVDGLVEDIILGSDPDGGELMPATRAWVDAAIRFTDVLASETNAQLARGVLREAGEAFAADGVEWLRVGRAAGIDPVAAVEAMPERPGRGVLVLDLNWLEPRLRPDPEILARLDPAPWEAGAAPNVIEASLSTRQRRSARLVNLDSRANRANDAFTRDLRWVISAAHASIDDQLGELLDAATATGASVLLTATSSSGLGRREAVGPGMGAALDVARVPAILRVPGGLSAVDDDPRQWIRLDGEWFATGTDADRYTWALPAIGASEAKSVCEVRWTTREFTLLDTAAPRQPPRLFDRLLDPAEWYDRAVEYPALADSLREALRDRLYGPEPVLVLRAGDEPADFLFSSPVPFEVSAGGRTVRLEPGQSVRVRMIHGAENLQLGGFHALTIGGEEFLLTELVVHSAAWRALLEAPGEGPDLTAWLE